MKSNITPKLEPCCPIRFLKMRSRLELHWFAESFSVDIIATTFTDW